MTIETAAKLIRTIELLDDAATRGSSVAGWRLTRISAANEGYQYIAEVKLIDGRSIKVDGTTIEQTLEALGREMMS